MRPSDPAAPQVYYEGSSLAERMRVILDDHSQLGSSFWDGVMGSSKHIPSLAQVEQLLGGCSGFVYLGTERFAAHVPPGKLAALDLSDIVDLYDDCGNDEGSSLAERMRVILDDHSQLGSSFWDGVMGSSKHIPRRNRKSYQCDLECTPCLEAVSNCRLALLFDLLQKSTSAARQSDLDLHKRAGQLALEEPVATAMLLSLCGVRCVVLHQWPSAPRTHSRNIAALLDGLLGAGLPSGQALHGLRKGDRRPSAAPESNDEVGSEGGEQEAGPQQGCPRNQLTESISSYELEEHTISRRGATSAAGPRVNLSPRSAPSPLPGAYLPSRRVVPSSNGPLWSFSRRLWSRYLLYLYRIPFRLICTSSRVARGTASQVVCCTTFRVVCCNTSRSSVAPRPLQTQP
ncbi:hypothetical protein CRUP_038014 [Coryphaenoides rupestris]|nr:hypothetical protein CRUP_038014 [Coryphaenoides rupestris]